MPGLFNKSFWSPGPWPLHTLPPKSATSRIYLSLLALDAIILGRYIGLSDAELFAPQGTSAGHLLTTGGRNKTSTSRSPFSDGKRWQYPQPHRAGFLGLLEPLEAVPLTHPGRSAHLSPGGCSRLTSPSPTSNPASACPELWSKRPPQY